MKHILDDLVVSLFSLLPSIVHFSEDCLFSNVLAWHTCPAPVSTDQEVRPQRKVAKPYALKGNHTKCSKTQLKLYIRSQNCSKPVWQFIQIIKMMQKPFGNSYKNHTNVAKPYALKGNHKKCSKTI